MVESMDAELIGTEDWPYMVVSEASRVNRISYRNRNFTSFVPLAFNIYCFV
jgi:hypothetical protein